MSEAYRDMDFINASVRRQFLKDNWLFELDQIRHQRAMIAGFLVLKANEFMMDFPSENFNEEVLNNLIAIHTLYLECARMGEQAAFTALQSEYP
jgi:hypothetical protein